MKSKDPKAQVQELRLELRELKTKHAALQEKYDLLVDTLLAMVERSAREHSEPRVRNALLQEVAALRKDEVAKLRNGRGP